MSLPKGLAERLALPVIAAPMTSVSGPELVVAACRRGVIGAFPVHNARRERGLDAWLDEFAERIGPDTGAAPFAANLIVHRSNTHRDEELAVLIAHRVELVITSVGSPAEVIAPLHAVGSQIFSDVATVGHAHRALEAGADGLVLLSAGAGGQTGWANPFAFVRAVRRFYDGPVVLAGGITDGASLFAARALGADLAYLGTRFIATRESLATPDYRSALVEASLDDVVVSDVVGGLPANLLRSWLVAHDAAVSGAVVAGGSRGFAHDRLLGWDGVFSAGHSVSGVDHVLGVGDLVDELAQQYHLAEQAWSAQLERRG